jgi:HEAT repeat protein
MRHTKPFARLALWAIAVLLALPAFAADTAALVAKFPAQGAADGQALAAELVKLGPAGVKDVCGMLREPGKGDDSKARFALHGVVLHVLRPGADSERRMVEGALMEALAAAANPEVKAFLLEQLKFAGTTASVAPLAGLLGDERLCDPATMVLLNVRTPEAAAALAKALPDAKGRNLVAIVRALGVLREKSAAKAILPYAGSEDATLRQTAWYALANMGEAEALAPLTKAAEAKAPFERSVATRALLLLVSRLGEAGDKATCAKTCRDLIAARTAPRESNVVCEALAVLAQVLGAEALPELMAALDHKDLKIREAALNMLQDLPGPDVAAQLASRMKGASSEARAAILRVIGARRDKAALPLLTAALQDEDAGVRAAAVRGLTFLGGADALAPLVAKLNAASPEEARAIREALATMEGEGFVAALGAALGKATPAAKVVLLEILGARAAADQAAAVLETAGDADANVRLAAARALATVAGPKEAPRVVELLLAATDGALRSELSRAAANACRKGEPNAAPLLGALPKAQGEARAELLKALAWVGGAEALQAVLTDAKSDDAAVREAALRALGEWNDAASAEALLNLTREAKERTHQVLALRGYLRVVGLPSSRAPEKTVEMLKQALAAVKEADDRKQVLGALGNVRHAEAAALAATCLADAAVKEEAAAAVIRICCPTGPEDKGLRGAGIAEVLA